jgi:hypothetical protein
MIYELKDCRTGEKPIYDTTVEITEKDGVVKFKFTAHHTEYYSSGEKYNDIHSAGDACEILIGSDPERKVYYEIEISTENQLMIAKMTNCGVDEQKFPVLDIDFVEDCFVKSNVERTDFGYIAELEFELKNIMSGDGEIYFNAYRLETDGGELDKHLFALFPTMFPKFHVPSYFRYLKDFT